MKNYFKIGDTVTSPGIWGNRVQFTILRFLGNDYCPIAYVQMHGKPETIGNHCNIDIRDLVLIDAIKRPMRNVDQAVLCKMAERHVAEAEREILIRKQKC